MTASDQRVEWLRSMLVARCFGDKVQELFMLGKVEGTTHLGHGQEAVAVGAIAALEERDYLTITYRGHGHALARGLSAEAAFGELMGLSSGSSRGVGGSMHLTDFSRNLIGSFAIIGAGLPVAVGAAVSAQMRGSDAVAVSFSGDGGTNIGTFHEALNMAAVWKAPVVFIVENNLYGEYSPIATTTSVSDIAERASAYAIPGVIVDGQDIDAVNAVAVEAVLRARAGFGPTLIEAKTYRFRGHSRSDPASYRPEGELDSWLERDPIELLADRLIEERILDPSDVTSLRSEVQSHIDKAADDAARAPIVSLEEVATYVYSV